MVAGALICPQMRFNIHMLMQNPNHLNFICLYKAIENNMLTDLVFAISFPDVVTRATQIRGGGYIMKGPVYLCEINVTLIDTPFLRRVSANAFQIGDGLTGKIKRQNYSESSSEIRPFRE